MKKQKTKQIAAKIPKERQKKATAQTQIATKMAKSSFMTDTDEVIDTAEIEEEDWIEHMKRSTRLGEEKMRTALIPCWIMTHKKMKWRLAMRIASQPETRWSRKAAKWNPGLNSKYKASRAVGRPRKRWEDDINQIPQA